jgi:hypothetical protein
VPRGGRHGHDGAATTRSPRSDPAALAAGDSPHLASPRSVGGKHRPVSRTEAGSSRLAHPGLKPGAECTKPLRGYLRRSSQLSNSLRIGKGPTGYVGFEVVVIRARIHREGMLTAWQEQSACLPLQGISLVCSREADLGSPDLSPAVLSTSDHLGNNLALPRSCPHSKGAAWEGAQNVWSIHSIRCRQPPRCRSLTHS